ncbi:MAG: hypothetical protein J0H40_13560 [Rhizobiales bacterium]|nr:hypothetical protein [Hyphomicrobiales bacterium]
MELNDLVSQVAGFDSLAPGEKIRLLAWWLHTHQNMATFRTGDIRVCYQELHLPVPNIAMYLTRMTESKPAKTLRKGDSYNLTRAARSDLDEKYGIHPSIQAVSKLLIDLPEKVPDLTEKVFLREAIDCYRVRAYRACIVMTWNLAFDHLLKWILKDAARLAAFNAAIGIRYPKRAGVSIKTYDNFADEFKESEIVEVCNTAQTVNSNVIKILKEKLTKRNMAAHPSSVVVVQPQADDVVTDLINNVVLALP